MPDAPTDSCRLFLFRHPELDPSHQERAVGAGDAALGRRGRAQVAQWLQWLEGVVVHEVHCSPQPQCLEPATAVAQRFGLQPKPTPRLVDQQMGQWEGLPWSEVVQRDAEAVRTFFAQFGEAKAPGGESLGEAVERVLQWWTETAPHVLAKSLVVVLPGSILAGFTAAMLGLRLSRCVSVQLPHGGLGVLDVFQNGVRVACWNRGFLD